MICPHCAADLKYRERTGRRCSRCRREFALEPKTDTFGLHDLRMRRVVSLLTDPVTTPRPEGAERPLIGPMRYTAEQLRFATARKTIAATKRIPSGWFTAIRVLLVLGFFSGFIAMTSNSGLLPVVLVVVPVLGVLLLVGHFSTLDNRRYPGEPVTPEKFGEVLARWQAVYGTPPPGLLPPRPVVPAGPPGRPRCAVFCPVAPIVDFLAGTDLPRRRGVLLVPSDGSWPPLALVNALQADATLPVLALHDADPFGVQLPARLRAALPPGTRVVDIGLGPTRAAAAGPPVRRRPDATAIAGLPPSLTVEDRAWLAKGMTFPLVALRPARLLRAVERAIDRLDTPAPPVPTDPEQARLASAGFLNWPERLP